MKRLFTLYGDVISFDLSFNMIKDSHPSGKKWKVGFFLGTSSCKHMVPLGLVLTLQDTKDTYVRIFQTFFRAVGGRPKVIVTDEERAIRAALIEIESLGDWNGLHLYDAYHILHNVRKKLTKKEDVTLFARLLHAKSDQEWRKYLPEVKEKLPSSDLPILEKFVEKS